VNDNAIDKVVAKTIPEIRKPLEIRLVDISRGLDLNSDDSTVTRLRTLNR